MICFSCFRPRERVSEGERSSEISPSQVLLDSSVAEVARNILNQDAQSPTTSNLLTGLQISRTSVGTLKFDKAFEGFSLDQMWRLFIDWERQKTGAHKDSFDVKEPGYRKAMEDAFAFLRTIIDQKVSPGLFVELHDRCIDGVQGENGAQRPFSKGFNSGCASYPFDHYTGSRLSRPGSKLIASLEALQEGALKGVFATYPHPPNPDKFLGNYDNANMRGLSGWCSLEQKQRRVDGLFIKYYERVELAQTKEEKLEAIVDLCRELEVFHLFQDGNQRTIAFALLTKLLIENGFSPCILETPVCFDGYFTTKELVFMVQLGMERFERVKKFLAEYPDGSIQEHADQIDAGILFQAGVVESRTYPVNPI